MTKPTTLETTLETAINRLRENLTAAQAEWEEARALFVQAETTLNRRRERVVALTETLNLLHPVSLVEPAPPAVRAKPGAVEAAIHAALESKRYHYSLDRLVEDTGMNRGSLHAALRRMVAAGTVMLEDSFYRRPAADPSAQPAAE